MGNLEVRHAEPLTPYLSGRKELLWRSWWQWELSPAAQALYLALRQHPGQTVDTYYFAARLGLTEKELLVAYQELEERGLIMTVDSDYFAARLGLTEKQLLAALLELRKQRHNDVASAAPPKRQRVRRHRVAPTPEGI